MPNSFESIATIGVTSNTSTVSFSSIPTTYQHLQVRGFIRTGRNANIGHATLRVNGGFGARYHAMGATAPESVTVSGVPGEYEGWTIICPGAAATSGVFGAFVMDVLDYASTSKVKSIRIFSGMAGAVTGDVGISFTHYLYNSTSQITSLTFAGGDAGNVITGTKIGLYGIKNS